MNYKDFSVEEIDVIMQQAWNAFHIYRKYSLKQRAGFMRAIAVELENCGDALIQTAMRETNLPEARLRGLSNLAEHRSKHSRSGRCL